MKLFTAFDLECNQPSKKIIQIGAVVGDLDTGDIIDKMCITINPMEQLGMCEGGDEHERSITDLTGITQAQVDAGVTLEYAYIKLNSFHSRSFINPIVWGGGDARALREQLSPEIFKDFPWCFGRREIDVKTLFIAYQLANGKSKQAGLSKAMSKVGLSFRGHAHRADWDAENTWKMFVRMLELYKEKT